MGGSKRHKHKHTKLLLFFIDISTRHANTNTNNFHHRCMQHPSVFAPACINRSRRVRRSTNSAREGDSCISLSLCTNISRTLIPPQKTVGVPGEAILETVMAKALLSFFFLLLIMVSMGPRARLFLSLPPGAPRLETPLTHSTYIHACIQAYAHTHIRSDSPQQACLQPRFANPQSTSSAVPCDQAFLGSSVTSTQLPRFAFWATKWHLAVPVGWIQWRFRGLDRSSLSTTTR